MTFKWRNGSQKIIWVYRYGLHRSLRTNAERSTSLKLIDCISGPIGGLQDIFSIWRNRYTETERTQNKLARLFFVLLQSLVIAGKHLLRATRAWNLWWFRPTAFSSTCTSFFGCGQSSSPNHTQQHVVKRNRPRANSRLSVFGQSRSLETLKHWKAFEFKSFLFYGYVMLSGCLSHYISHFSCLSLAIRALVEESSDVKKRVAAGKLPLSAAMLKNNTARVQRCLICMTFYT